MKRTWLPAAENAKRLAFGRQIRAVVNGHQSLTGFQSLSLDELRPWQITHSLSHVKNAFVGWVWSSLVRILRWWSWWGLLRKQFVQYFSIWGPGTLGRSLRPWTTFSILRCMCDSVSKLHGLREIFELGFKWDQPSEQGCESNVLRSLRGQLL
jgi:hypothetical protein